MLDLLHDGARSAGDELLGGRVVEQDRDGVDGERIADALKQGIERRVESELGEVRVAAT